MQQKKSRAYYQYMLDLADNKVSYFSTDEISQVIYDLLDEGDADEAISPKNMSGQDTICVRLTTGTMPFLHASSA